MLEIQGVAHRAVVKAALRDGMLANEKSALAVGLYKVLHIDIETKLSLFHLRCWSDEDTSHSVCSCVGFPHQQEISSYR